MAAVLCVLPQKLKIAVGYHEPFYTDHRSSPGGVLCKGCDTEIFFRFPNPYLYGVAQLQFTLAFQVYRNGDLARAERKACVLLVKDKVHVLRNGLEIKHRGGGNLFFRGIAGKNKLLGLYADPPGILIICNDWAVFGPSLYLIGHCRFCFFWIAYGEASIRYFGRLKEIVQCCGGCEHEVHAPCSQHGGQSNKN